MKCPYCDKELVSLESENDAMMCPKCSIIYHHDDLQRIKDAEMIDEDMVIWRDEQKFR